MKFTFEGFEFLSSEEKARVDELTEQERAQMDDWAKAWIRAGLRTMSESDEADEKARGEVAMKAYYKFAGYNEPEIIWVRSPAVVQFAGSIGALRLAGGDSPIPDWFTPEMRADCEAAINRICPSPADKLVMYSTNEIADPLLWRRLGGHMWPAWVAWRSFLIDVCGLRLADDMMERFEAWREVTTTTGWWWPGNPQLAGVDRQPYIVACWRPETLRMDQRGRLHCEDGPAISYPDGFAVYSIGGVRITREIAEGKFTAQDIVAQKNAEVRRVMLKKYGEGRFIEDIGAKALDSSKYGTLYRVDLQDDEPLVMVRVVDATPAVELVEAGADPASEASRRIYWLRVDPECRPMVRQPDGTFRLGAPQKLTARNAVASTFGKRGEEYNPAFES